MSPGEVLAKVLEAGGQVVPDPKRPRLLVPSALKPLVVEHREALRHLILYQDILRLWWGLTTQGANADRQEVAEAYQQIIRLQDEVGEPTATQLRRRWAREWHQERGICPWCGDPGVYHDPEQGGEPA